MEAHSKILTDITGAGWVERVDGVAGNVSRTLWYAVLSYHVRRVIAYRPRFLPGFGIDGHRVPAATAVILIDVRKSTGVRLAIYNL